MTITTDLVQEVFNTKIYPELKQYVEEHSIYKEEDKNLIVKNKPSVSKQFPIVPVKLLSSQNTYGNLSYTQERFSFGIEIDINAQDKTIEGNKISKRIICEEITSWIIKYFKENYRVIININPNAPITDELTHRAVIRVSGVIDTRYGVDKLVVYPR